MEASDSNSSCLLFFFLQTPSCKEELGLAVINAAFSLLFLHSCLDRARKGRLSSGPRDPLVLLACLGLRALEDPVHLGHRAPQGHQDHQLSLEQVSAGSEWW